jgi:hypothetical protein
MSLNRVKEVNVMGNWLVAGQTETLIPLLSRHLSYPFSSLPSQRIQIPHPQQLQNCNIKLEHLAPPAAHLDADQRVHAQLRQRDGRI